MRDWIGQVRNWGFLSKSKTLDKSNWVRHGGHNNLKAKEEKRLGGGENLY